MGQSQRPCRTWSTARHEQFGVGSVLRSPGQVAYFVNHQITRVDPSVEAGCLPAQDAPTCNSQPAVKLHNVHRRWPQRRVNGVHGGHEVSCVMTPACGAGVSGSQGALSIRCEHRHRYSSGRAAGADPVCDRLPGGQVPRTQSCSHPEMPPCQQEPSVRKELVALV
jgi:hypothetical protein